MRSNKNIFESKIVQKALFIYAIVLSVSLVVPPIIWISLAKSDNNYLYITFSMLTLAIPITAGTLVFSGHFEYKIFRFVNSFIIAGLTYALWNKMDSQVISILIQDNMMTRLYIRFFFKSNSFRVVFLCSV